MRTEIVAVLLLAIAASGCPGGRGGDAEAAAPACATCCDCECGEIGTVRIDRVEPGRCLDCAGECGGICSRYGDGQTLSVSDCTPP